MRQAIGIGNVGAIMKSVSQGLGRINPTDEEGAMKASSTSHRDASFVLVTDSGLS